MKKIIYLIIPIYICFISCEHDPVYTDLNSEDPTNPGNPTNPGDPTNPNACDPNLTYFANDVMPIIASNCAITGCHGGGSAQDGVNLSTYEGILDIINLNDPIDSELIKVITDDDPDDIMPPPPNNSLTQEQIATLLDWINQGAPNNECSNTTCDLTNVTYSQSVWPIIQNNCTGCHSGGNPSGGISITNYAEVSEIAGNGFLSGVINHDPGYVAMPLNTNQLSQCDIDIIDQWIADGYPDN